MQLTLASSRFPLKLRLPKPMTDRELMHFCAENDWLRVEREPNGDLLLMTPAGLTTGTMNERISRALGNWADDDGRGISVGSDTGFNLPDRSMRNPDAAWMSNEKYNALTKEQRDVFPLMCPEFIIELRSHTDRLPPLKRKMEKWIANGAEVAWLIDPKKKTVTIYRQGEAPEELFDPSSVQGTGPIRGFELVMSRVWGS